MRSKEVAVNYFTAGLDDGSLAHGEIKMKQKLSTDESQYKFDFFEVALPIMRLDCSQLLISTQKNDQRTK
ncbi:hypothetical protein ACROYT_G019137 [Oculina patagonica]